MNAATLNIPTGLWAPLRVTLQGVAFLDLYIHSFEPPNPSARGD
jgi:hypothetical protein